MSSTPDPKKIASLKKSLARKFKKLQVAERIAAIDVVDDLAVDLNKWSLALTGEPSRQVDEDGGTAGIGFVIENGRPYAVVVVDMLYADRNGKPIDIDFLTQIIPGVTMRQDHDLTSGVHGGLTFDLTTWPSIVADLLFNKVYKAYLDDHPFSDDSKNKAREDVLAMTAYFYPSLTEADWLRASDIGMLDNWTDFNAVLNQHKVAVLTATKPPSDIANGL